MQSGASLFFLEAREACGRRAGSGRAGEARVEEWFVSGLERSDMVFLEAREACSRRAGSGRAGEARSGRMLCKRFGAERHN